MTGVKQILFGIALMVFGLPLHTWIMGGPPAIPIVAGLYWVGNIAAWAIFGLGLSYALRGLKSDE